MVAVLVGSETDAGNSREGLQSTRDDFFLSRGCRDKHGRFGAQWDVQYVYINALLGIRLCLLLPQTLSIYLFDLNKYYKVFNSFSRLSVSAVCSIQVMSVEEAVSSF